MSSADKPGQPWLAPLVITVVGGVLASLVWFYVQNWLNGPAQVPAGPQATSPLAPASDPARPVQTEIELSRTSGPVGTVVRVSGRGFGTEETVIIRFHAQECTRADTDAAGAFERAECQIPRDWKFTGTFDIVATGVTSVRFASMPFRVT